MNYVVRTISPTGTVGWICPPNFDGLRVFGERESAEIFATRAQAYGAIHSLSKAIVALGASYSIEAVNRSAGVSPF